MRLLENLAGRGWGRGASGGSSLRAREGGGLGAQRVRMAAAEMRVPALGLLGHAQGILRNPAEGPERAQAVAAIAAEMLDLADALEERATEAKAGRALAPEAIGLGGLVGDAVETVTAALGSGRRLFRIAPSLAAMGLKADRRALRQVLNRVLTSAARSTREGDWIEIMPEIRPGTFALVVADEGSGLAGGRGRIADRRGLGFGLSLARILMEAHGGSLAIESLARIGTRVTLFFPSVLLIAPPTIAPARTAEV